MEEVRHNLLVETMRLHYEDAKKAFVGGTRAIGIGYALRLVGVCETLQLLGETELYAAIKPMGDELAVYERFSSYESGSALFRHVEQALHSKPRRRRY